MSYEKTYSKSEIRTFAKEKLKCKTSCTLNYILEMIDNANDINELNTKFFKAISGHPDIELSSKQVKKYSDKLDWGWVSCSHPFDLTSISEFKEKINFKKLIRNKNVNWSITLSEQIIKEGHVKTPEDFGELLLSLNKKITVSFINSYAEYFNEHCWHIISTECNQNTLNSLVDGKYKSLLTWDALASRVSISEMLRAVKLGYISKEYAWQKMLQESKFSISSIIENFENICWVDLRNRINSTDEIDSISDIYDNLIYHLAEKEEEIGRGRICFSEFIKCYWSDPEQFKKSLSGEAKRILQYNHIDVDAIFEEINNKE